MIGWLRPQERVDERELERGLRALTIDGACSQVMGALTGGAFLVSFALLLGAPNVVIGVLAAVGPLTQLLQLPATVLVERTRARKTLVVLAAAASRLFWLPVIALPWLVPEEDRVTVLVTCLVLYFGLGTISGCAWTSWVRDLVPERVMGSYFGRRMAIATAVGAAVTLLGAFVIEHGEAALGRSRLELHALLVGVGAAAGFLGITFLARIPEPRMAPADHPSLLALLSEPLRDRTYRQVLWFLGAWGFATQLAAPFFAVYMLRRLEMELSWVLGLSVLSQVVNVLSLRLWGRLGDRFGDKPVLGVAGPLLVVSTILWPFTTMPERWWLTLPLIVVIHVLAGMSTAGVVLCAGNLALKAAPQGKATAYLATNAVVGGLAATLAPLLGGVLADRLAGQELVLALRWAEATSGAVQLELPAFNLRGLDFIFVASFVLGVYALHLRAAIREEGERERESHVVEELYAEVRKAVRHVSNVAGVRQLYSFPFARLIAGQPPRGPAATPTFSRPDDDPP